MASAVAPMQSKGVVPSRAVWQWCSGVQLCAAMVVFSHVMLSNGGVK